MTSEKASWAVQTAFDGGIQQLPETATKNSVLDALNVWTPFARAERRPGYSAFPAFVTPVSGAPLSGTGTLYDPTGTFVSTGNIQGFTFPASVAAGSTFVVTMPAFIATTAGVVFNGTFPAFMFNVVGVLTARGVVVIDAVRTLASTSQYGCVFVLPADTLVPGNIIQLTFFITVPVTTSPVITSAFPYTQILLTSSVGLAKRIQYNSGTRYFQYRSGSFNQSDVLTQNASTATGLPGFPAAGSVAPYEFPPQVAVIPEIDTSYFVLGGATVRLRKNNVFTTGKTDAAFATSQDGTVIGVPATAMACYGTFPGGSQIINFRGHLFANGSYQNDQQNILFWNYGNLSQTSSGAIVDTTNIWPVTAFAALSDARDNSEITTLFPVGDNLGVSKEKQHLDSCSRTSCNPGRYFWRCGYTKRRAR
jgi:hypothetical protein